MREQICEKIYLTTDGMTNCGGYSVMEFCVSTYCWHRLVIIGVTIVEVKVEVKGHVIRALFSYHENRFFSWANGSIVTKLTHDGPQAGLHPRCAQRHGRGQRSRDTGIFLIPRKSLLLSGKWLDRHQTYTRRSPDGPASRMCSRSRSR